MCQMAPPAIATSDSHAAAAATGPDDGVHDERACVSLRADLHFDGEDLVFGEVMKVL